LKNRIARDRVDESIIYGWVSEIIDSLKGLKLYVTYVS
jgi:hypothetical protein